MTMEKDEQPIGKRPFPNTASTTTSGEHDNNDGIYKEFVNEMGNKDTTQLSNPPGEEANAVPDTVAEVFINHGEYDTFDNTTKRICCTHLPSGKTRTGISKTCIDTSYF